MNGKKPKDGRANNTRPKLEPGEKRELLRIWAKKKNHATILAKIKPIVDRMDK